jgi:hypothetical protein
MALGVVEAISPTSLESGTFIIVHKAPNAGIASGEVEVISPMSLESETPFGE